MHMTYKIKTISCTNCGKEKTKNNRRPFCGSCAQKARWNTESIDIKCCLNCSEEISRYSKKTNRLLNPSVYNKRQYCSYNCNGNAKAVLNNQGQKLCQTCNIYKDLDQYYFVKRNESRRLANCIECISFTALIKRREKRVETLIKRYNLSLDEYELILKKQNYKCGICKIDRGNKNVEHLFVDHDHKCCPGRFSCGKCVRGLLCDKCNRGGGFFNDDPTLLLAAATFFTS